MLEAGASMPEFKTRNTQREEVTDEAFRRHVAVLAFFPMAFTGG